MDFKEYNVDILSLGLIQIKYISSITGKTITEVVDLIKNGNILATRNETLFSRFAYFNIAEDRGLKPMKTVSALDKFLFMEFLILPKENDYYKIETDDDTVYFYVGELK